MHHVGAAFGYHFPDDQHERPFIAVIDIHGRIKVGVPMAHSVEECEGCYGRLAQGNNDTPQNLQFICPVDIGGFL